MRKVTELDARWAVKSASRQHSEDTPARGETPEQWEDRLQDTANFITWQIGANVSPIDLEDIIVTWEELDSVDCGTHPDLNVNNAGTVDDTPKLREDLARRMSEEISFLLSRAGFLPIKQKVSA